MTAHRENTARGGYAALARRKAALNSTTATTPATATPPVQGDVAVPKQARQRGRPLSSVSNTLERTPAASLAIQAPGAPPGGAGAAGDKAVPARAGVMGDNGTELEEQERQLQEELAQYDLKLGQLREHQMDLAQHLGQPGQPRFKDQSGSSRSGIAAPAAPAPQTGPKPVLRQSQASVQHSLGDVQRMLGALIKPQAAGKPLQASEQHQQPHGPTSIVRSIIVATGHGCRDVLASEPSPSCHIAAAKPACWITRGHRVLCLESSCLLQLQSKRCRDVTVRISFADAASVPGRVRFEHAPRPSAAFEPLGEVRLQPKSLRQLRHLFHLSRGGEVKRCLRITLLGHLAEPENCGAHRVSHLRVAGLLPAKPTESDLVSLNVSDACIPSSLACTASFAGPQQTMHSDAESAPAAVALGLSVQQPERRCDMRPAVVPPLRLSTGILASLPPSPGLVASTTAPRPCASACDPRPAAVPACSTKEDEAVAPSTIMAPTAGLAVVAGTAAADSAVVAPALVVDAPAARLANAPSLSPHGKSLASPQQPKSLQPQERTDLEQCKLPSPQPAQLPLPQPQLQQQSPVPHSLPPPPLQQQEVSLPELPANEEHLVEDGSFVTLEFGSEDTDEPQVVAQAANEAAGAPSPAEGSFEEQVQGMAASVADAAKLLSAACSEVEGCELLATILRAALLAGGFLTAGCASTSHAATHKFQVDALLNLKEVKSSRTRCRTLLHFVAREAARKHPANASLLDALPSCPAAARIDLPEVQADLQQLAEAVGCWEHETAVTATAYRVEEVCKQLRAAEAAFRHLGTHFNGEPRTMADPCAFFCVLHTFALELEAAHADNETADDAAGLSASRPASQGSMRSAGARRDESNSPTSKLSALGNVKAAERCSQALLRQGSIDRIKRLNNLRLSMIAASQHCSTAPASAATDAEDPSARGSCSPQPPAGAAPAPTATAGSDDDCKQQTTAGSLALAPEPAAVRISLSTPVVQLLEETVRLVKQSLECERERLVPCEAHVQAEARPCAWQQAPRQPRYAPGASGEDDCAVAPAQGIAQRGEAEDSGPEQDSARSAQETARSALRQRLLLSPTSTPLSRMGSARQLSERLSGSHGSTPPASSRLLAALRQSASSDEQRHSAALAQQAGQSRPSSEGDVPLVAELLLQQQQEQRQDQQPRSVDLLASLEAPSLHVEDSGFASMRSVASSLEVGRAIAATSAGCGPGAATSWAQEQPHPQLSSRYLALKERQVEVALQAALAERRAYKELAAAGHGAANCVPAVLRGVGSTVDAVPVPQIEGAVAAGQTREPSSKRVSWSMPGSPRQDEEGWTDGKPPASPVRVNLARAATRLQASLQGAPLDPAAVTFEGGPPAVSPTFVTLLRGMPTARPLVAPDRPLHKSKEEEEEQAVVVVEAVHASPAGVRPTSVEPSPIKHTTRDMDRAVASLVARVGNSPTGPLARGVRDSLTLQDTAAAEELRASMAGLPAAVHLLEPLMPAPLGEGVRGSDMMAEGLTSSALRSSLELPRRMLRSQSAPTKALCPLLVDVEREEEDGVWGCALPAGESWDLQPAADGGDEALATDACVHLGGLSPAGIALQHALAGGEMSPATAALQQVYEDVDFVLDEKGDHFVAAGYHDRSKFNLKRLLGLNQRS